MNRLILELIHPKRFQKVLLALLALIAIGSCIPGAESPASPTSQAAQIESSPTEAIKPPPTPPDAGQKADIITVEVSGDPGVYQFSVEIRSPDQGCAQFADWWEIIDEQGNLIYRRVLTHSHVNEQPFTRSGGPVPIEADTVVWVRAHMQPGGYGGIALKGSVLIGFQEAELDPEFADWLAETPPLPEGCAF